MVAVHHAMRIATWNVNSLRVRLDHLLAWLDQAQVDLIAIQETKVEDGAFPFAPLVEKGYTPLFTGQKTYNGVAFLSRLPMSDPLTDLPGVDPAQKRFLAVTVGGVRLVNVYVPNGQSVGSEAYHYKLSWLEALRSHLEAEQGQNPRLLVLGDFNIAPEDRDVHDPAAWEGNILVSEPERAAFRAFSPLIDCFRRQDPATGAYTWWDYRQGGFRRNWGMRIDHILATPALAEHLVSCRIDKTPRGWERPSDHAPVVADFSVGQ